MQDLKVIKLIMRFYYRCLFRNIRLLTEITVFISYFLNLRIASFKSCITKGVRKVAFNLNYSNFFGKVSVEKTLNTSHKIMLNLPYIAEYVTNLRIFL